MPERPNNAKSLLFAALCLCSIVLGLIGFGRQVGSGVDTWPQGTLYDWIVILAAALLVVAGTCSAGVTIGLLLKKRRAMLGLGSFVLAVLAFGVVVILSQRARTREWRVHDYSNIRCLPTCAITMYVDEHNGVLPKDLGQLVDLAITQGGHLVASGSGTTVPRTGDDVRAGHCDYEYYGGGQQFDRPDADKAILLMSRSTHVGDWVSIAFFDRSTACVRRSEFARTAARNGWFCPDSGDQAEREREQEP